ncbi:MAG: hypothetical protein IM600_17640 [Bacteroidetes bacterium]|nr:hypothetical protein [Bacteroidota bacterium]MCA6445256.1 hypothetical protein [Bacteroidota bacterium]
MFKFYFLLMTLFCTCSLNAQEPAVIKFKKESKYAKAVFDNVDNQLVVIDVYGNPTSAKIAKFKLYVKTKKDTKEFAAYSNALNMEMLNYLKKLKSSAKLFFTEINVQEEDNHLSKLPDAIEQWFPVCNGCKP